MPYRRLPNTDKARIRALKRAQEMGKKLAPSELAYSPNLYSKISSCLPNFEQTILMQKEAYNKLRLKSNEYKNAAKRIRLYLSHFIQVFNMAVMRGEYKAASRIFFEIDENDTKVPDLSTDNDLLLWGERIITGESKRIAQGETTMQNPKITVIKVYFNEFKDKQKFQKILQDKYLRANLKVSEMRPTVDELILQIWNEVEKYFDEFPAELKREYAKKYGVVYFYRTNEKKNIHKIAS